LICHNPPNLVPLHERPLHPALNSDADSGGASAADDSYNLLSGTASTAGSSAIVQQWKILIYDTACRSIISPILSVSQLRNRGVTLHLLLHSDREPIPDVPAVYFVEPTRENLARIAQDCAKGLYARSHDRGLMEEFARLVVHSHPRLLAQLSNPLPAFTTNIWTTYAWNAASLAPRISLPLHGHHSQEQAPGQPCRSASEEERVSNLSPTSAYARACCPKVLWMCCAGSPVAAVDEERESFFHMSSPKSRKSQQMQLHLQVLLKKKHEPFLPF
jgi:hypothetical protein